MSNTYDIYYYDKSERDCSGSYNNSIYQEINTSDLTSSGVVLDKPRECLLIFRIQDMSYHRERSYLYGPKIRSQLNTSNQIPYRFYVSSEIVTYSSPEKRRLLYKMSEDDFSGEQIESFILLGEGCCFEWIGNRSFKECKQLKEIVHKNRNENTTFDFVIITKGIGEEGFRDCQKLEYIPQFIFADTISIKAHAFNGCKDLDLYDKFKPEKEDSALIVPGPYAFANTATTQVLKYLNAIPDGLFQNCTKLQGKDETIILPKRVKQIGNRAFENCTGIKYIKFNTGINRFGESCFENCENICGFLFQGQKDDKAPESDIFNRIHYFRGPKEYTIEKRAFFNCSGLAGTLYFEDNIKYIGESAFEGCTGITNVVMPLTIGYIGMNAFKGCKNLKTVEFYIPDGYNEENSIEIQRAYIGCGAFRECGQNVTDGLKIYTKDRDGKLTNIKAIGKGCFHEAKLQTFKMDLSTTKYVGGALFYGCEFLSEVEFTGKWLHDKDNLKNSDYYKVLGDEYATQGKALFGGCEQLTKYRGPINFVCGHDSNRTQLYWNANQLESIVLLFNGEEEIIITKEQIDTLLSEKNEKLTAIYIANNNNKCYLPNISSLFDFDKYPNLFCISHCIDGNENLVDQNEYNTFSEYVASSDTKSYYIGNDICLYNMEQDYDSSFKLDNAITHLRISTDNDLSKMLSKDTKLEYLAYIGEKIKSFTNEIPSCLTTQLKRVFLLENVKIIGEKVFNNFENPDFNIFLYITDNMEQPHPLNDLECMYKNSLPDSLINEETGAYQNNEKILIKATLPEEQQQQQKKEYNCLNYQFIAKGAFDEIKQELKDYTLLLPFIGVKNYNQEGLPSVTYSTFQDMGIIDTDIKRLEIGNSKIESILKLFSQDKNNPVFGNCHITELVFHISLDINIVNEHNYIFSQDNLKHLQLIKFAGNTSNIPMSLINITNNEVLNLPPNLEIDCGDISTSNDKPCIFHERCFYGLYNGNIKFILPLHFQFEHDCFNYGQHASVFKFSIIEYNESLENFVINNQIAPFSRSVDSILQYCNMFKTKEEGKDLDLAPRELIFTQENIKLPEYIFYNNQFLKAVDLKNVAEVGDLSFGRKGQVALVAMQNKSDNLTLSGATALLWEDLNKGDNK